MFMQIISRGEIRDEDRDKEREREREQEARQWLISRGKCGAKRDKTRVEREEKGRVGIGRRPMEPKKLETRRFRGE